jgi:hypothetical protein
MRYDPLKPAVNRNPYPHYDVLRRKGNNREFPHFQPSRHLSSSEKATDHRRFSANSLSKRSGNPDGRSGNYPA